MRRRLTYILPGASVTVATGVEDEYSFIVSAIEFENPVKISIFQTMLEWLIEHA
jgi:hypothetical protein